MRQAFLLTLAALCAAGSASAQPEPAAAPSPGEIVAAAPVSDWVDIPAGDLLVMTLAPDAKGKARRAFIQLMPQPLGQGWVENIRLLTRARWYDGLSINRAQDNYVVQWGDAEGDDPKRAKPLPAGLKTVPESEYVSSVSVAERQAALAALPNRTSRSDPFSGFAFFLNGWPLAADIIMRTPISVGGSNRAVPPPTSEPAWPVHCYAMVGVGRGLSPDTGSGAELYVVIGHAPRHLDRNIALVGRVVEGMEHLSSLPRGAGALGFYEEPEERTPIRSVRLASDLPAADQPHLQYLATGSASFARYADARANRRDPFFLVPAGGADICNIPVPIRRKP
ncbi:MAG: peptidylprolyl isomerase [Sphingomonas sp.]|nr:peptidylprolyl isomerase [Sphingomonas sp.]